MALYVKGINLMIKRFLWQNNHEISFSKSLELYGFPILITINTSRDKDSLIWSSWSSNKGIECIKYKKSILIIS